MKRTLTDAFERVLTVGLALPGVEAATKYDGSPMLKVDGSFMAGLAMHPSAERDTLVVRTDLEEREAMLEEAPETYYLTDYYRNHPVVLVRLSRLDRDALRDLLSVSRRLTLAKRRRDAEGEIHGNVRWITRRDRGRRNGDGGQRHHREARRVAGRRQ